MASSRYESTKAKQEQTQQRRVLPGSPFPGYGVPGGRPLRHCQHRAPFRLPSLNASPTCSVADLSTSEDPMMSNGDAAPLYTVPAREPEPDTATGGVVNSNFANWRSRSRESPAAYRKTLEHLSALRKQRPMLGSTSDYFSLTSSVCSEDGDYCPFEYENDDDNGSDHGWPLSPADIDELRSVAEKVLQGHWDGDEVRIKADLLDNICQQTRELERRNEELRQELEQLHFDTKRFVEKTVGAAGEERKDENVLQWNEDYVIFDGHETTI